MRRMIRVLLVLMVCVNYSFAQNDQLTEFNVRVDGSCGMCKDRIEKVAIDKGKAEKADWNVETGILTVFLDESSTSIMNVTYYLAQAGHDNVDFKAPDDIYNELHGCCKYRIEEEAVDSDENHEGHDDDEDGKEDHKSDDHNEAYTEEEHPEERHEDLSNDHQHYIAGYIYGMEDGKKTALIGANVTLKDKGEGTATNFDGYFELDNSGAHANEIEISYIGYDNKTIEITETGIVEIILDSGSQLETVEITYKKRTTEVSFLKPLNIENITREELCKAACCNLSESFETNPSVDVSYPDAITGTRQIQMLGLAGPYVQITRELIPDVRSMSSIYGLSMTPGPWIENIQLIKGVGSVVNGFESITGQINVELKKPEKGERAFLNGYVNNGGRVELNANTRYELSDLVSTGLLLHGKTMRTAHDNNGDGFTDMPIEKDFLIANRWKFEQKRNFQGQIGVKVSKLNHEAGTHDHFADLPHDHEKAWTMNSDTDRYELWGKLGFINQEKPNNSVGLQLSGIYQDQNAIFGQRVYRSNQKSLYGNLIFQHLSGDQHIIRTGISYLMDNIEEDITDLGVTKRMESIPGAYLEYTYQEETKWAVIPGIRADYHNQYGLMVSPRLHAKYNFSENGLVRLVAGKGWRTASIFAENLGLFSSSRGIEIETSNRDHPYGLDPEEAWNYGLNYTQGIDLASKELIISLDVNRTDFVNQVIVDFETPGKVSFYNLEGKSYSNSFQAKIEYELFEGFDLRMAYRLFDVKSTYDGTLTSKPLVSRHRAFINAAYKTTNDWHFDATINWNGQKRLPFTASNPQAYQREDYSPSYFLVNAQIMKRWNDKWDVYLGAENLLNYKQNDAIIAADDPFGSYFDASIVWAPLFGSNIYLGFRMTIGE